MSQTLEHKCPSCGASLQFDIASQMVKCPYCDCEFDAKALLDSEEDLSIDANDLASDAGAEWEDAELYGMTEYQCQSCGGNIYSESTTSATLCPYCGNAVILKGRLSGVLKPDKVIPFQQTKETAIKSLEEHCGGKRFVPKEFIKNNKLEEIKGLYVPFWVYDAELDANVVYSAVDTRRWTSGNTEYTERRYYKVIRNGDIAFDHVPADGSSKMPDDLMESIEPFDYDKAEEFNTGYLTGYVADKYDLDQEAVRPRVRKRMADGAAQQFMTTVHHEEIHVENAEISAKSSSVSYVLYPVWMMNTDWNGQKFMFAMNGQTGKIVGNLPMDVIKLGGCTGSIFAGIVIASLLLMYFFGGGIDIGTLAIACIIGGIAALIFYKYFQSQLKNVEFKHGARDYYRQGSMNIRHKSDIFLYKRVTTRRIDRD